MLEWVGIDKRQRSRRDDGMMQFMDPFVYEFIPMGESMKILKKNFFDC